MDVGCSLWGFGGATKREHNKKKIHPYIDTPLKVGVDFWEIGSITECESCCKVMVEASKPRRLHPTSISYIYNVF